MRTTIAGAGILMAAVALLGPGVLPEQAVRADGERTFAVRARRIYPMIEGGTDPIDHGTVLVRDGKIAAVGRYVTVPEGVRVIDAPNAVLVPGFVAASTSLGGPASPAGRDDAVDPRFRAIDRFDTFRPQVEALREGVTTAFLHPGRNRLVSGQGAIVKLAGGTVLAPQSHLAVNLGDPAFSTPPKQEIPVPSSSDVPLEPAEPQRPTARISQFAALRESFDEARAYRSARRSSSAPEFDARLHALADVLERRVPMRVSAPRAEDILGAIRHRELFGGHWILAGVTEGQRVASEIAASGIATVVEIPFRFHAPGSDRGVAPDALDETIETAAKLADSGVPLAISAGPDARPGDLVIAAMAAVRGGLEPERALAAITRDAARVLGVSDRVGSLAPGRDADFVLLSGEPLRTTTHVQRVFVDGRDVFRAPSGNEALVIRAGTIHTGRELLHGGAVLVENGKITAVGRTVPVPRGARVVDAGPDGFVTPGFIDAHGHLGLEGDQSSVEPDISLARAVAHEKPNFPPVARSGVTTALVAPYQAGRNGSQVLAMKTSGTSRDALVVADPAAVLFSLRGSDPLTATDAMRDVLKRGQAYIAKWKKYEQDLKKWEEQQEKKKEEAERKKKEDQKKKEQEEKEEPEKKGNGDGNGDGNGEGNGPPPEKPKADPLTGTWQFTLSGGPFPEQTGTMKLKLEGSRVSGSIVSPIGGEAELTGTFDGSRIECEIDIETPLGPPILSAQLKGEDYLEGTFAIGDAVSLDFKANRTEKEAPEIKIKRRKKREDGRPVPPPVDEALEPIRAVLEKKIPVMIDVRTEGQIDAAIALFEKEFEVPVVLLNADRANRVTERIAASDAGVIVPPAVIATEKGRTFVPADTLSRAGIPVAFQSGAEDAARTLPLVVSYAVYHGMDAESALRALTFGAAEMLRLERVGSLEPGKDGDVLVFDGPPFETASRLLHTFIAGKEIRLP